LAGDEVEVIRLLQSGVLVDARDAAGFTALMCKHQKSAQTCLAKRLTSGCGEGTSSGLMRAAYARHVAMVRLLLDCGADPNARALMGETPLMGAALGRSLEVIRLLLDRGADINAVDVTGATALQAILQQKPGDEDPDAVVEYCDVVDLLQSAHTGVCI
jgi:ankyrin repeat protein